MADSIQRLRDRSATEAAIVQAGEAVLLRDGFTGLNVQTIAAQAGCDRKLVYRYFDGAEGVVRLLAQKAHGQLADHLAAVPPVEAESPRAFARHGLLTWFAALRASPLALRLMAWAVVEDSPLLREIEADRNAVLQAWMRERRPRLRTPPRTDVPALNAVLMAAVQALAIASQTQGSMSGVTLDAEGCARIEDAIGHLLAAWPD